MNKRPEKTEQTKRELTAAFWQLYATTPVEHITVAQICEKAGYHRGTFYLHFHDVYELLEQTETAVLDAMTTTVERCMQKLLVDSSKVAKLAALKDVVLFYEQNKKYLVILMGTQGDQAFVLRMKEELKPLWLKYVIGPTVSEKSPAEVDLLLEYTLTGSLFMIGKWLADPQGISAYQLGHLVYDAAILNVPK